jgi:hypothetical protein
MGYNVQYTFKDVFIPLELQPGALDAANEMHTDENLQKYAKGDGLIFSIERGKCGQEKLLFKNIAEFINPTAVITAVGEDGAQWRWTFKKGVFTEEFGKTIYCSRDKVLYCQRFKTLNDRNGNPRSLWIGYDFTGSMIRLYEVWYGNCPFDILNADIVCMGSTEITVSEYHRLVKLAKKCNIHKYGG